MLNQNNNPESRRPHPIAGNIRISKQEDPGRQWDVFSHGKEPGENVPFGAENTDLEKERFTEHTTNPASREGQKENEVLIFIRNFVSRVPGKSEEVLYDVFASGYCFYFAYMLKLAFGRGRVCLAAPFGHIVWEDVDHTPYDINGVCDSAYEALIPIEELGDGIEGFMHVPGKDHFNSPEEVRRICAKYGVTPV